MKKLISQQLRWVKGDWLNPAIKTTQSGYGWQFMGYILWEVLGIRCCQWLPLNNSVQYNILLGDPGAWRLCGGHLTQPVCLNPLTEQAEPSKAWYTPNDSPGGQWVLAHHKHCSWHPSGLKMPQKQIWLSPHGLAQAMDANGECC